MKTNNRTSFLSAIILLGVLAAPIGSAQAARSGNEKPATSSCTYAASGTGMGGTGITSNKADSGTGGTGMGGTGIVAQGTETGGTGMGGTGITAGVTLAELQFAGKVISSAGHVEARSNGRIRLVAKGGSVCVGETIVTANAGSLEIRMIDDAFIAVRPQTRLKIDQYAFNGTDKDASKITVIKGASRFVTGKLGKRHPQNDLVETPNAIIGVLGTDHEVKVILPGESGGYLSGTYDKVNQGITYIKTDKGRVDIHPNQVGLAVSNTEKPVLLSDIPEFYKVEPPIKAGESISEGSHKNEGVDEGKQEDKNTGQKGEVEHVGKPQDVEHLSIEPPEGHTGIETPEAPEAPEAPEQTEVPETPEQPAVPELPDAPEPAGTQD